MSEEQKNVASKPAEAPATKDLIKAIASIACGIAGIFIAGLIFGVVAIGLAASCEKKGIVSKLVIVGLILGGIDVIMGMGFLMG